MRCARAEMKETIYLKFFHLFKILGCTISIILALEAQNGEKSNGCCYFEIQGSDEVK